MPKLEKTHLRFCYQPIDASITQNMHFLYINVFILEISRIYFFMETLTISLHGNVNISKFIKTNPLPPKFDQPPPYKLIVIFIDFNY